jgi:hypothetical protein
MLVLDTTTKSIKAVLAGAIATTNPDFTVAFADNTGSAFTEGANDGAFDGTNSVTIVAAPAAATRRIVKSITIENKDTAAVTVTLSYDNNATLRTVVKVTLQVGDTWTTDGTFDTNGNLKQSLGTINLTTQVTGTLPVANGGTGITSFGTGVATFLGTPSSANLAAALTDETGTGIAVFGTNPTLTGVTLAGEAACADNLVTRATLKDYAIEGSAVGNTGATSTLDLAVANFFSATLDQACTFTFSNPPASGDFGTFVLELTNGGAFAITYPASVDFVGGVAPTLTASGVDQLVFTTRDGGTTYFAFVAGLDIKSP